MWPRVLFSICLLFSLFYLPFWASFVLMLSGVLYFKIYLEAVFLMLLSDMIFGVPEVRYGNIAYISFFAGLLILGVIEIIKKKTKFDR